MTLSIFTSAFHWECAWSFCRSRSRSRRRAKVDYLRAATSTFLFGRPPFAIFDVCAQCFEIEVLITGARQEANRDI